MPILRDTFLAMSTNPTVHRAVVGFPLSRRVTRRFVAGETLDEAIQVIRKLNQQNLKVTLDVLGESVKGEAESRIARDQYLHALDAIAANRVSSNVSVKLTQMGLAIDPELCLDNMRQIVGKAKAIGSFTRIDMEGAAHTQSTLNIYKHLREEFDNVGIVIQAYLYRSEADMQALLEMGGEREALQRGIQGAGRYCVSQQEGCGRELRQVGAGLFERQRQSRWRLSRPRHARRKDHQLGQGLYRGARSQEQPL